jgi:ribose 5-phosphate isomerase B
MRVALGTDEHTPLLDELVARLAETGHEAVVVADGDPWPDVGRAVGEAVAAGRVDRGVVCCWTGTGVSMAANKVPGVRAALAWEPWIARNARLWNDANVLALSLKRLAPDVAVECVAAFLEVPAEDPDETASIDRIREL